VGVFGPTALMSKDKVDELLQKLLEELLRIVDA